MIRYNLVCVAGHDFESWFRDAGAFDKASAAHAVTCPECGTGEVVKALMAPSVATARKREATAMKVAAPDPRHEAVREMVRQLRQHVTDNAENVGSKFAEEARKIHYQEVEARGIYGEASVEEARALMEEGVDFLPLPVLPEDGN
jgi:hypothetical protein